VIFVHRTAPGDLARVEVSEAKERWARGRLLEVVAPSPERREPPCPFYAECGGCTVEHLTYESQLRAKSRIVADALTRIGGFPVDSPEVVPSPVEFRYRNRVSFALRRLPTGRVVAGFHSLHDPDRIVDLDGGCLLPEEPIARVWDRLRAAWGPGAEILPSGDRLRLTLRATETGSVSLLIEGGNPDGSSDELLRLVEGLESVWHRPDRGQAALVAGAPGLPENWGEESIEVGGTAFLQVNRAAARHLEEHVLATIGDPGGLRIVDAYCGVGLHARRLARGGATVVGIELDLAAVEAARVGAPPGASFVEGAVEDRIPECLPADLVILNPPRAGISPEVVGALLDVPPERMVYISCNPATLARDLRRLGSHFALSGVRSFDLFPQTAHVETVAALSRVD
jgi:23S rRNA (uracil1939-C5)-methyltransferase